jgi:hypothetical protein
MPTQHSNPYSIPAYSPYMPYFMPNPDAPPHAYPIPAPFMPPNMPPHMNYSPFMPPPYHMYANPLQHTSRPSPPCNYPTHSPHFPHQPPVCAVNAQSIVNKRVPSDAEDVRHNKKRQDAKQRDHRLRKVLARGASANNGAMPPGTRSGLNCDILRPKSPKMMVTPEVGTDTVHRNAKAVLDQNPTLVNDPVKFTASKSSTQCNTRSVRVSSTPSPIQQPALTTENEVLATKRGPKLMPFAFFFSTRKPPTTLHLASLNVEGVRSNVAETGRLLEEHDIMGLQEHWLFKFEEIFFTNLCEQFF